MRNQAQNPGNSTGQLNRDIEERSNNARVVPRITIHAFCEDQSTATTIQVASEDRRLSKAHVTVQMGGVQAAIVYYQDKPSPNLIILESLQSREQILDELDQLANFCDEGTKVMVLGHVNDVLLYRELIARGVNEYLVAPLTPLQVMESISNLYGNSGEKPVGSSIVFLGAKGGSGSSTICHNTAWAISEQLQAEITIADFDLPFGTAGLDFNQDPIQGIADALGSPDRLDEMLLDRLLSKCSENLSLFAAPSTLDREYDLTTTACERVMEIVRQNIPYIAVDLPHLWTSWSKKILIEADEIVITAMPDLASLRNTKNIVDLLKSNRTNDNPPFIVLNNVKMPKRPEISIDDFANAIEAQPHAVIEYNADLFGTAANNGQMIEEVASKSDAAQQFRDLAYLISRKNKEASPPQKSSLLSPLLDRLKTKKTGT